MTAEQAQINAELRAMQSKEREQVRDFIERLVESLLGGELDTVSVKKIYNDERYLPIAGESPCAAHTSLKKLIQHFIREASELPELRKSDEDHPVITDDTNDRTYEDLLSTAIINKVVQSYQQKPPSVAGSSSSKSKRSTSDKEYFLGERNLDTASKFDDTSSVSSLDEYINNNGSTKYMDQMNFAIQQSIKEVSSSDDEEVNYDIDELDSSTSKNNDWQENWYLRKRNFGSGTNSPVPVPMLVPNPNTSENAKVLIGDREIDDTSDLSDAASDYEDTAEPSSLNAVLINSKNLIGGRNPLVSMVVKAESIIDDEEPDANTENQSTTTVQVHHEDHLEFNSDGNESIDPVDQEGDIIETCNEAFIREPHEVDLGASGDVEDQLISLESNTEKYSEYTEKYATLPRKIPMPTPRQSKLSDIDFSKTSLLIEDSKTDNGDSGVTSDEDDKQKSFKGSSYSEREKDKWNHAVDLPNNPYSKSNLESRLSNRSNRSSISSVNSYGRDYFAKAAAKPQGAIKKSWMDDDDNLRCDGGNVADDEERKVEVVDEPIVPQANVFRAVPALIQMDDEETTENQPTVEDHRDDLSSVELSTPTKRLQPWDLSSDSDYSIERTYNVNSGKIIKKLGDMEYELPITEVPSAEGLKYTKLDENQNSENIIQSTPKLNEFERKRSFFMRSLTIEDDDVDNMEDLTVTPPTVNHFKLVHEIANETDEQYKVEAISPPAEYRNNDDVKSIEYESEEKSYDFSIESTYEDEERLKAQEQTKHNDTLLEITELIEESINRGIIEPEATSDVITHESIQQCIEESLNIGIKDTPVQIASNEEIVEESQSQNIINIIEEDEPLTSQNLNKVERLPNRAMLNHTYGHLEVDIHLIPEPEIEELQEKQLVKNMLGVFSKSYPNLTTGINQQKMTPKPIVDNGDILSLSSDFIANSIEIEEASPKPEESVQNLKKKFENDSDTKKDVEVNSSLTARSVPKQMRQQLAQSQTNVIEKPRRHSMLSEPSIEPTEDTIDSVQQVENTKTVSFPKAKSRIAFFEKMNQK